ncbi:MAG: GMC family oxidoreductase [Polyangiaceae bacterium]|nr:GMC family oxidoreductase [Polyangiaceae bacterium]
MTKRFDFIVVGGGSSGCIVASKLAERGHSVLLLEAGDRAEENPETLRADGYKEAFINDRLMHERFTIEQAACGGRRLFAGTGRGIGGSGAINAMVYTRGAREDFDAWGEGWRWDDVRPDFEELESKLRPNRREETSFTRACIQSAEEQGLREKADLNDGDLTNVLGHEWMNYEGDKRRNAYVAFIQDSPPRSLTIETGARATSIGLEDADDGAHRAVSISYEKNGETQTVFANKEIVLAAGALATPALLLASGIGPASELRTLGRPYLVNIPGVGRNLHDHPNVTLFFLANHAIDCSYPQLYGFGRMKPGKGPSDSCFVFYPARSSFREGLMRMLPAMVLPERTYFEGRAVRLMRGAISTAFKAGTVRRFVDKMWGIVVILGKPVSRGTVRLGPISGGDTARIDPAYLSHPDDLETMVTGVRHARKIAASAALHELGSLEVVPGTFGRGKGETRTLSELRTDRTDIERFLRKNLMTTYHFAGTCKMGDDNLAVVDRNLRVRGIRGLRVADASAIPETPVAAMNAPSMLVGLRGAKHILEDHPSPDR